MRKILIFLLLLTLVFTSCFINSRKKIKGSGNVVTKDINTSQFGYLYVDNDIEVFYQQDSICSIKAQTDDNLIEYLDIDADYRYNLKISVKDGYKLAPTNKIKIYITSPNIAIMEASGASSIYSQEIINSDDILHIDVSGASKVVLELNATTIKADISGASTLNLSGTSKQMEITASGASTANCSSLIAAIIEANIAGASNADFSVNQKLKADVSGASSVTYKGNPEVSKNESGAGTIKRIE